MFFVKAAVVAAAVLAAAAGPATAGTAAVVPASVRPGPVNFSTLTVYAVGPTDNYVAEWTGTAGSWTFIGGAATHVYAGSAGVFATDPTSGDIWQYDGTPGQWTVIGGPGNEFAEGGGHLYGLGPNDAYIAEYDGTPGQWTIIQNQPTGDIYAGTYGLFAIAKDGVGDLIHYNGTPDSWTNIGSGDVSNVAVGTNAVYAVSIDCLSVSEWNSGTGWELIGPSHSGDCVDGLTAGGAGLVIDDEDAATSYLYGNAPYKWTAINVSPYLVPDAISPKYIYGVDFSGGTTTVEMYAGTGTQWTTIGGTVTPPLAAAD